MSTQVSDHLAVTLPSDPKYLPLVRALVDQGAEMVGFDTETRHNIVLAVTEAMTNVIRHAYQDAWDRRIDLVLQNDESRFHLEIIDYGEFISPDQIASRPLDEVRPGGLGVHLIKSTMDAVEYKKNAHGGTTLTLEKSPHTEKEAS